MICYLHIGIPKTGTTAIQSFCVENSELLKKSNILYANSIQINHQHWELAFMVKQFIQNGGGDNDLFEKILTSKLQLFKNLKKEIMLHKEYVFLFSSEAIIWEFSSHKEIVFLKKMLYELGFKKIYIVLYLRETVDMLSSLVSQSVVENYKSPNEVFPNFYFKKLIFDFKWICRQYLNVFSRESLVVRLFDKNEFYKGDLLKDFINVIGLNWNLNFKYPVSLNKSLNLIGIELQKRINIISPMSRFDCCILEYFTFNDPYLKFQPKKEIMQSYLDYFEESNEWVRKEFFSHKERLFPKKDLSNYKENYELKEMKPEYWDKIAEFIVDIVKTKNQIITNKEQIIQNQKNKIEILEQAHGNLDKCYKHGTAKSRIQNQLSYKLGQAMIVNSKSILGYIRMPFVLSYIKDKHKQEQQNYQEKIKKDPSLKLPLLESYPDYQEALKEKECLTYKLGQALIQANKTWYKGGYVKMWFEIGKLKREFRNKGSYV